MEEVELVVAHHSRATLRVGHVFLKIDTDQTRTDVEVEAMAIAPIPTPEVLWRKPPVLALAALPGTAFGRLGEPSTASASRRPRRRRRGPRRVPPHGSRTTRRCRRGVFVEGDEITGVVDWSEAAQADACTTSPA